MTRYDGIDVAVTHPERVIFPGDGITKGDLAEYYAKIAPVMLPFLHGRPLTLIRHLQGIGKPGFVQQNVSEYFPGWLDRVAVPKEEGTAIHPLAEKVATLVYLANQSAITLHCWTSRIPNLTRPDLIVFDLDPADDDFAIVRQGARDVKACLESLGLTAYVQTSGSRGLHVVTPVTPDLESDEVLAFAREVAAVIAAGNPDRYTTELRTNKRGKRLFLDTGRNAYAQTFAAPYTVRARPGAPVATPFRWEELSNVTSRKWTIRNVFERLEEGGNPWEEMEDAAGDLPSAVAALEKIQDVRR